MALIRATLPVVEPGRTEIHLPHWDGIEQQHGFIHGGVVGMIADSAAGYAAMTLVPADASVLTVEYKMNLMAPAEGERLIARGEVVRAGRTLIVTRAEVLALRDGSERPCALMQQTIMVMRARPRSWTRPRRLARRRHVVAIEPVEAAERRPRQQARAEAQAQMRDLADRAAQVIGPGVVVGGLHHPAAARHAPGLIVGKAALDVGVPRETFGQHPGILERHVRALSEEGQRRMGGIAENGRMAAIPCMGDRMAEEPQSHTSGTCSSQWRTRPLKPAKARRRSTGSSRRFQPSCTQRFRSSTATMLRRVPPRMG